MLEPLAITMYSNEVNFEKTIEERLQLLIPDNCVVGYDNQCKSYIVGMEDNDINFYNNIINNIQNTNLQNYQTKLEKIKNETNVQINLDILNHLSLEDNDFFNNINPLIQEYIDNYLTLRNDEYRYITPDKSKSLYPMLSNETITETMSTLLKIKNIIEKDIDTFQNMVNKNIIQTDDIDSMQQNIDLFNFMNSM